VTANSSGVLFDDLQSLVAKGQLLAVVGAGVSVGAAGAALTSSWTGLLHDGVTHAEQVCRHRLPLDWAGKVRPLIDSGDLEMMLASAELITKALGGRTGGEYRRWLRASVGQLKAVGDRSVLEALVESGVPLATTNYDGLLEEVSGLPPITWQDGARVQRVLRGDEPGVLHLHGFWRDSESVVLGIGSYQAVLGDATAQALQRGMASLRSLLFIGFGAGLSDPNFGALLKWVASTFPGSEYRHFRVCKADEVGAVTAQHQPQERIMVLSYGSSHADLAPFLLSLKASADGSPLRARAADASPMPAGLPALPICLGREDRLNELVASMLASPPRPVPVLGGPGIGKTTMTLAAMHDDRVTERFGVRRWFVRCDGATGAASLLTGLGSELELSADGREPLLPRILKALMGFPGLLVLDNLETPWSVDVLAVEELLGQLSAVPGLMLVATVRGTARPKGLRWRDVDPLTPLALPDARAMFLAVAGGSFASDPELDGLLEAVDRLPLAVELLAYNAEGEADLSGLRLRWNEERAALLQRPGGFRRELSLAASLELSLASPLMTDEGRRLLKLLGRLPDGAANPHLDQLLPGIARRAANVLRQLALAFDDETGRLRCLAPIREHVSLEHPPIPSDLQNAVRFYMKLVARIGQIVGEQGGAAAATQLAAESGNVWAAIHRAAESDGLDLLVPAIRGLVKYLRFTGAPEPSGLTQLLQSLPLNDEWDQAEILFAQATLTAARSDPDTARSQYERALGLYRRVGDVLGEGNCIQNLGDIALRHSDHDTARSQYERALPLYQKVGHVLGEANCIQGLADIALRHSDHDTARSQYERALPFYQKVGHVRGEANCIQGLGDIALRRSDHDTARNQYERALPLYRQVGSVLGEANCIQGLGDIALRCSDSDTARTQYEQARPLYQKVSDVLGDANCIRGLADIALLASEPDIARAQYEQALPLYRQIGSVLGEANCIQGLGNIALRHSDHDTARSQYERALPLYRQIGSVLGEANCVKSLGDLAFRRSDHDTARNRYEQALNLYMTIKDQYGIGAIHRRLARLAEPTAARRHVEAAHDAWQSINRTDLCSELKTEFAYTTESRTNREPGSGAASSGT
jgi:tetratricopeptide (TPR) repeat protein